MNGPEPVLNLLGSRPAPAAGFAAHDGWELMAANTRERCRFRPPERSRGLIWEVIEYCNLQCLHCCTDSGPWLPRKSPVTTQVAIRLLHQLPSAGVTDVMFSGGEPFFRADFVELLEAADSSALEMSVNTNGYLVNREVARRVAGAGLRQLTISLDGHNAELHNKIRKHPKAFQRAVTAISECVEAGVPVRVSGVITPEMVDHVEEWVDLVYSLGARVAVLNTMFPVGRAAQNPDLVVRPSEGDLIARLDELRHRYAGLGFDLDYGLDGRESPAPTTCTAGYRILHLAPNGDLSGCSWLYKLDPERFTLGSVITTPIDRILARVPEVTDPLVAAYGPGCPLSGVQAELRR